MSGPTLTEQVQALIEWASAQARLTGVRHQIRSVRYGRGWYYEVQEMTRPIGAWHRRPM